MAEQGGLGQMWLLSLGCNKFFFVISEHILGLYESRYGSTLSRAKNLQNRKSPDNSPIIGNHFFHISDQLELICK